MIPGQLTITRYPPGSNFLASLESSLSAMLVHMDEYISSYHQPDRGELYLPYCLNERTLVGLFAGGVWRSNPKNLVLEEYGASKHSDAGKYSGRHDFWCRVEGRSMYMEAKKAKEHSFTNPELVIDKVLTILEREHHDASRNASKGFPEDEFDYVCGVVFNTPFLSVKKLSNLKDLIESYQKSVRNRLIQFTNDKGLAIVRACFIWSEVLNESIVYSGDHGIQRYPMLEIYFATSKKNS